MELHGKVRGRTQDFADACSPLSSLRVSEEYGISWFDSEYFLGSATVLVCD